MNHDITPQEIKEHFHMIPLDQEGGVYCQTYIWATRWRCCSSPPTAAAG